MRSPNGLFEFSMMVFGIIYGFWFVPFIKVVFGRYKNKIMASFFVWAPFAITGMYLQTTNQFDLVLLRIIPEPLNTILLFASWPIFFLGNIISRTTRY